VKAKGRGKFLGDPHPAPGSKGTRGIRGGRRRRLECFPVRIPVPVYLGVLASRAKHKVRGNADQTVSTSGFAALDRFKDEVPTLGLKQLQRSRHRRLGVCDAFAP